MLKEWLQSILIFFLCFLCLAFTEMGGKIKDLQENWGEYRCNPAIIPIAGYIAPGGETMSTSDNMSYCVQSVMASFAPTLLQPLSFIQQKTTGMVSNLTDSMYAARQQQVNSASNTSSKFGSVYGSFANIIVAFHVILIKLVAAQGKSSAVVTTLMYVMNATKKTFESMWEGVPGKMIQMLGS